MSLQLRRAQELGHRPSNVGAPLRGRPAGRDGGSSAGYREQGYEALPTVPALQSRAAAIRQGELREAFGQLGRLSDAERQAVVALATAITDGILRHPLQRLQRADSGDYDSVLRDLFGLDGPAE